MSNGNSRAVAFQEFKHVVTERRSEFANALPRHIPVERFERVVLTAIQNNLQLLDVPRRELFNACVKAAQDGLLPDGREGALVVRPGKKGTSVTWQPMIAGIRKKVRNSGEIATWDVQAVYSNDQFEFALGDDPYIKHKPALKDRGELIAVYSVATLKSGEKSRDVMSVDEVIAIRDRSDAWRAYKAGKIKSTPWQTDFAEMAKKTVARRHSKVLPMSTDLDDLLRRDDELYDFKSASDAKLPPEAEKRSGLVDKLDALASPGEGVTIDGETGEVIEDDRADPSDDADEQDGNDAEGSELAERAAAILENLGHDPAGIDVNDPVQVIAYSEGMAAAEEGKARNTVPDAFKGNQKAIGAYRNGYDFAIAQSEDEDEGED